MLDVLQIAPADEPQQMRQSLGRRRPRFTRTEILALNQLVNAEGEPVTVGELGHTCDMMESSIVQLIYRLRVKLGEDFNDPKLITSASFKDENGVRWKAYRFNEAE